MEKEINNLTINIDIIKYGEKCNIITFKEDNFNENQCNSLSKQYEKLGLLNCKYKFKDNSVDIYYLTTNLISINQYFNKFDITKTEFISIIKTICQSIKMCSNYVYFYSNNFVIDEDLVYINPSDKSIHILYVPTNKLVSDHIMNDFKFMLTNLINNNIGMKDIDNDFKQNIIDGLINSNSSLDLFLDILDKSIMKEDIKKPQIIKPILEKSASIELNNINSNQINKPKKNKGMKGFLKKIFSEDKTIQKENKIDFNKRNIVSQNAYETNDDTVILGFENKLIGYLIGNHQRHTEQIQIDKDEFIIGRSKDIVDYDIANKTVGKKHAKFIRKEGKFYLLDLESKNGTYLNNTKLESNAIYEVEDNSTIIFSNVKYIFRVTSSGEV